MDKLSVRFVTLCGTAILLNGMNFDEWDGSAKRAQPEIRSSPIQFRESVGFELGQFD